MFAKVIGELHRGCLALIFPSQPYILELAYHLLLQSDIHHGQSLNPDNILGLGVDNFGVTFFIWKEVLYLIRLHAVIPLGAKLLELRSNQGLDHSVVDLVFPNFLLDHSCFARVVRLIPCLLHCYDSSMMLQYWVTPVHCPATPNLSD